MDGDGLIGIREVAHDALSEYVEGATEEDLISGRSDNVYLHVEGKAVDGEGDVAC